MLAEVYNGLGAILGGADNTKATLEVWMEAGMEAGMGVALRLIVFLVFSSPPPQWQVMERAYSNTFGNSDITLKFALALLR